MKQILNEDEKKKLIQLSNKDREYKLLLHLIVKDKHLRLKDVKLVAAAYKKNDFFVDILRMDISDEIKVYFISSTRGIDIFASEILNVNDTVVVKGYKIVNDGLFNDFTKEFDKEEYANLVGDLNKKDEYLGIEDNDEENNDKNQDENPNALGLLPCIYGNWCGPLCSGPEAPISAVDRCCMYHDQCYGANGYFNCNCDRDIILCLLPYYYMGSEWAIVITEYFLLQYSINCE